MTTNAYSNDDNDSISVEGYRIFISHSSCDKNIATTLKHKLELFGFSVFVAHDDIRSGERWQIELEKSLRSADAMIALLTPKFRESVWTDQEVGMAYAYGLQIIPITTESNIIPHGFLGQYQRFRFEQYDISLEVMKFLIEKEPRLMDDFIDELARSFSWAKSGELGRLLPHIQDLNPKQIDKLVSAVNENDQVYNSFYFRKYIDDLKRLVGDQSEQLSDKFNRI